MEAERERDNEALFKAWDKLQEKGMDRMKAAGAAISAAWKKGDKRKPGRFDDSSRFKG